MANTRWAYLLVYDDVVGTREQVKDFLNSRKEILNWYHCLPDSFFIVSNKTANDLTTIFRQFTQDRGRFLILDVNTDRNGWLPKQAWEFMRNPKASWE